MCLYVNRMAGRLWLIIGSALFLIDAVVMLPCRQGSHEEVTAIALVLGLAELFLMAGCHYFIKLHSKKKFGPL